MNQNSIENNIQPKPSRKKWSIGLRTWKTVIAVGLTAALMKYGFDETPFFGCIGAAVAIGRSGKESIRNSVIRNVGTLVGGLVGILMMLMTDNIFLFALGVIPVVMIHHWLDLNDSIIPGLIVYFAVVYLMVEQGDAEIYALRRIFYTFVGTAIGFVVNMVVKPPPFHHHHHKAKTNNNIDHEI